MQKPKTPIKKGSKNTMSEQEFKQKMAEKYLTKPGEMGPGYGIDKKMMMKKSSTPMLPVLKTKKASTLKTSADQPRELMKRTEPKIESKKKGIKGLIGNAMNKAMSTYKKTEKVGMGGRSVSKEKGLFTRDVDGKGQMVREKSKTVKRGDGTVKKTVTKGRGVTGSNIGKYKDVKRYK